MKRVIGAVLAIIAILAMALPAAAQTSVTTTANVGGTGVGAPHMAALFLTPNDTGGAGTNVLPEPPIPNSSFPLFPPTNANSDGWKRVNIYVAADDNAVPFNSSITGIDVTVNYPATSPYAGQQKFNLTASWDGSHWVAASNYGTLEHRYPKVPNSTDSTESTLGSLGTPPSWAVRQLTPATPGTTDIVDANADGVLGNDSDARFATFLGTYGSRVVYGTDSTGATYNATNLGNDFNAGKVLVLELVGWIWYHQDPIVYTETAVAYGTGGTANPNIQNTFLYVPTVSMYLDFNSINFGQLPNSNILKQVAGDNDLSTAARPTVWDNGNVNAQLSVGARALALGNDRTLTYGTNYNAQKILTLFDAYLDYKNADGTVAQSGKIYFNSTPDNVSPVALKLITTADPGTEPVLLRSCYPAQFDPSVRSENSTPKVPDNGAGYQGSMVLSIAQYAGTVYPTYFSFLSGIAGH